VGLAWRSVLAAWGLAMPMVAKSGFVNSFFLWKENGSWRGNIIRVNDGERRVVELAV
jgi:hypothetical protein